MEKQVSALMKCAADVDGGDDNVDEETPSTLASGRVVILYARVN